MTNYRVDLAVLCNKEYKMSLTLHNLSDVVLSDWKLSFILARFIEPESLSKGILVQTGSHHQLSPEEGGNIPAHGQYSVEFIIKTAVFTNYECGIVESSLSFLADNYQCQHTVDISPVALLDVKQNSVQLIATPIDTIAIIPVPEKVTVNSDRFIFSKLLSFQCESTIASTASDWLIDELVALTDLTFSQEKDAQLLFSLNETLEHDNYLVEITAKSIILSANSAQGFIHASASLLQLIVNNHSDGQYLLPCLKIDDKPYYKYRGLMLDCARHFHPIETVKRLVNQLAIYKFNYFHWHLTDDEGWRIEIKTFPELTEIGAWRGPNLAIGPQFSHLNEKYGGYYTQAEIKEVIAYAMARGITVIPEIDIPGHCRAAIKSLPHLLVDPNDNSEFLSIQAYRDNVLSPALPGTYTFLDTVMEEVCALFPSPYVHIGADEVPEGVWLKSDLCSDLMNKEGYSEAKELQGYLLRYVENKLSTLGKRMLGWQEVMHGDKVSKETVVYSWISEEAGLTAINNGFDIVMQPANYTYFDLTQDYGPEELGVDWAGTLTLEQSYAYSPLSEIMDENDKRREQILGVQCALWCEVVLDQARIDHMLFPRLLANSEVCWSNPNKRNWSEFQSRLSGQKGFLDKQKINYRKFN